MTQVVIKNSVSQLNPQSDADFIKENNAPNNSDEVVAEYLAEQQKYKQQAKLFNRKHYKLVQEQSQNLISAFERTEREAKEQDVTIGFLWYTLMWGGIQREYADLTIEQLSDHFDDLVIFFPLKYQELVARHMIIRK